MFTVEAITHRESPIYHSTYTGRPPDEPAVLGVALNEVFVPLLQKQFPEIVDFYLPPEGCSYRMAVVTMRKEYPGHAKRVMLGVWSFLRQFMYTKFVIVTDEDVNARDWKDVIWAMTTRMDPRRDSVFIDNTPIDYLDFASPVAGLGSKVGFDATNKWPGETEREWGQPIAMDAAVKQRVDAMWDRVGHSAHNRHPDLSQSRVQQALVGHHFFRLGQARKTRFLQQQALAEIGCGHLGLAQPIQQPSQFSTGFGAALQAIASLEIIPRLAP